MTCTVTDILRAADTSLLPDTRITFTAGAVEKQSGDTMIPNAISVTTDVNAEFEIELYPGRYVVTFRTTQDTFRAAILVPVGLDDAELSDLIDLADMDNDAAFTVRWGVDAATTIDGDGVNGLAFSSIQFGTVSVDATITAAGEYIYAAFPDSFTVPTIFELFGFEETPVVSSATVYQDGVATAYTVWRSPYALTGNVPTRVSNTGA